MISNIIINFFYGRGSKLTKWNKTCFFEASTDVSEGLEQIHNAIITTFINCKNNGQRLNQQRVRRKISEKVRNEKGYANRLIVGKQHCNDDI